MIDAIVVQAWRESSQSVDVFSRSPLFPQYNWPAAALLFDLSAENRKKVVLFFCPCAEGLSLYFHVPTEKRKI